jgi:hypothetical protein
MGKKKITQAVLDAAKKNADQSTGPRTASGKRRASRNAITHGFFARELTLNDEEKPQFEALRQSLCSQLAPKTPLQKVGFEEILSCTARCKLALRMEMRRVNRTLDDHSRERGQLDLAEATSTEWYLSGRQGLRDGLRLLEAVKKDILNLGRIDDKWHVFLDQAFGPVLREQLTRWMPSNKAAVMAAHQLTLFAENYNMPLPRLDHDRSSGVDGENQPRVILDPEQSQQMVIKLLDVEICFLSDLWKSVEQRASDSARAQNQLDFVPRYFPSACRDLHAAVEWYMKLKKEKI